MECSRCLWVLAALLLLCSCAKPAPTAGGFDWPVWRGPDGNGQSRETEWDPAAIAKPKVLWKTDIGFGYPNAVIQKGRLYAVGMKQGTTSVYCLDAATGRCIWKRAVETYTYPQASLTVDDDLLVVLSGEGYLYGIDSRSGKVRWRDDVVREHGAVRPYYSFAGSPIVEGDLVILTANTSGMAVRRDTGKLVWTSEKPPAKFRSVSPAETTGTSYSTPVVYGPATDRQAILAGWNGLASVNVRTGEVVWRFGWEMEPAGLAVDPILSGDRLFLAQAWEPPGIESAFLLRLGGRQPELIWRTANLLSGISNPVIIDGAIYATHGGPVRATSAIPETALRCLDLGSAALLWTEGFRANQQDKNFSITAAKGILIVLDDRGTLSTAEASREGFREIARCDVLQGENKPRLFWTPPVLCNARIYCRNFSGDLVCIDVSK